jgi:hypothetical protein
MASEKILCILWNPAVHHNVHSSPPPVLILSQMSRVHVLSSYLLKIYLKLSFLLHLGIPSGLFPLGFHTKTLPAFVLYPIRATWCAVMLLKNSRGNCDSASALNIMKLISNNEQCVSVDNMIH